MKVFSSVFCTVGTYILHGKYEITQPCIQKWDETYICTQNTETN